MDRLSTGFRTGPPPTTKKGLANVPTADCCIYPTSVLNIFDIVMKSAIFYIVFICAASVLIRVRIASVLTN